MAGGRACRSSTRGGARTGRARRTCPGRRASRRARGRAACRRPCALRPTLPTRRAAPRCATARATRAFRRSLRECASPSATSDRTLNQNAAMSLAAVRAALDAAPSADTVTLARRTRNALAQAVLAEALAHEPPAPAEHLPPLEALRDRLGAQLGADRAPVYVGGPDWRSHATDAPEPLHELVRG